MCPEERYDPTGQSEEATEVYAAPLTTLRNINRKGEREGANRYTSTICIRTIAAILGVERKDYGEMQY